MRKAASKRIGQKRVGSARTRRRPAQGSSVRDQLAATAEILRAISRSPHDVQPVLDVVAERAAKLCNAFDALIFLKSGDQLVQSAHFGPIRVETAAFPISNEWASGRAILSGLSQHIADLQNSKEYPAS